MIVLMIITVIFAAISIGACMIVIFARNTIGEILEIVHSEVITATKLVEELNTAAARLRLTLSEARKEKRW